jgi:hypothetical protein
MARQKSGYRYPVAGRLPKPPFLPGGRRRRLDFLPIRTLSEFSADPERRDEFRA